MTNLRVIAGGKSSGTAPGDLPVAPPIAELYKSYGSSVHGRCLYILKNKAKAEDAMQDVFARALENYTGFRAESSPLTWLITIATHHCLNVLRSERAPWHRRFEQEEMARAARHETQPGSPQAYEAREVVRKVLESLDAETQAIAIHYHVDEMTLDEVARAVGRSVPTVRKRLEEISQAVRKEV